MEPPGSFVSRRIGGWTLAAHPLLPVRDITVGGGAVVGWLVGWAVDESGEIPDGSWRLPCEGVGALDTGWFEERLYGLGGRFACVLATPVHARFYLDPAGTLAAVYASGEKTVASTTSLLAFGSRGAGYFGAYGPWEAGANQFFPAGTTSHAEMRRLLPNHYLDLNAWRPVRHWMAEPVGRVSMGEVDGLLEAIARILRRQAQAVIRRYPSYLCLTAGRDTRLILGAARKMAGDVTFITFTRGGEGGMIDLSVASALARRFGLRHEVLPRAKLEEGLCQEYRAQIGYDGACGKAAYFLEAARRHLDLGRALVTGHLGGLWKGFYWHRVNAICPGMGSGELFDAMKLKPREPFAGVISDWLDGVPRGDPHFLLDQMFLEQRVGCWASPHMYGTAPFAANLTPFCHRGIIRAMLGLPIEYRQAGGLTGDVLARLWPELMELPVNPETFEGAPPAPRM